MTPGTTLHASCVVVGEAGVLIRGPSGSGKSALARELILAAGRAGRFVRLVGDDRVRVANRNGRLLASAVAEIAGKLEARGFGFLTLPYESAAVVRLVVDCLTGNPPRLPGPDERATAICGLRLPRILSSNPSETAGLILFGIKNLHHSLTLE